MNTDTTSSSYGPLGTATAGRTERIERRERRDFRRSIEQGYRNDRASDRQEMRLRQLEQEVRCLRDWRADDRRENARLRAELSAVVDRKIGELVEELPEIIQACMPAHKEVGRNGTLCRQGAGQDSL
jgi:hypothetical protein